jgi:hypothetical protein
VEDSGGNLDIWGRHVSVTGTLDVMLDVATSGADDDQYLVVWQHAQAHDVRNGDVLGRRVTGSGMVVATETISVAVDSAFEASPDVVYLPGAGRYLAVWEDREAGNFDVYARVISATGALAGGQVSVTAETEADRFPRLDLDGQGGALESFWIYVVDWITTCVKVRMIPYDRNSRQGPPRPRLIIPRPQEDEATVSLPPLPGEIVPSSTRLEDQPVLQVNPFPGSEEQPYRTLMESKGRRNG